MLGTNWKYGSEAQFIADPLVVGTAFRKLQCKALKLFKRLLSVSIIWGTEQ